MAGYGDPEVRTGRNLSTSTRYTHTAVEIKIPIHSLAQELKDQLPLASAYKGPSQGPKPRRWKTDFLRSARRAATDLDHISEEQILKTVREYRSGRKKLPEITVVAHTKKKTA